MIPLGWVVLTPSGILPLVPSTPTLVTPRVSIVSVLVVLVSRTLISSVARTLVLVPGTLVLVPLAWVRPLAPTLVAFLLLATAHQVRWRTSWVESFPGFVPR